MCFLDTDWPETLQSVFPTFLENDLGQTMPYPHTLHDFASSTKVLLYWLNDSALLLLPLCKVPILDTALTSGSLCSWWVQFPFFLNEPLDPVCNQEQEDISISDCPLCHTLWFTNCSGLVVLVVRKYVGYRECWKYIYERNKIEEIIKRS